MDKEEFVKKADELLMEGYRHYSWRVAEFSVQMHECGEELYKLWASENKGK